MEDAINGYVLSIAIGSIVFIIAFIGALIVFRNLDK